MNTSGFSHRFSRGGLKRKRVDHNMLGLKKRRSSTVQTHTVSVEQIPPHVAARKMPATIFDNNQPSEDDTDNEEDQKQRSPEIHPVDRPRSLRVSLTIHPDMDTPVVMPSRRSSSSSVVATSLVAQTSIHNASPSPAPLSDDSFVTSSSQQPSPIQPLQSTDIANNQGLVNLKSPDQKSTRIPSPILDQSSGCLSDDVFSDPSTSATKDSVEKNLPTPNLVYPNKSALTAPPPPLNTSPLADSPEARSVLEREGLVLIEPPVCKELALPSSQSQVIVAPVTQLKPVRHRKGSLVQVTSPPPPLTSPTAPQPPLMKSVEFNSASNGVFRSTEAEVMSIRSTPVEQSPGVAAIHTMPVLNTYPVSQPGKIADSSISVITTSLQKKSQSSYGASQVMSPIHAKVLFTCVFQ